MLFRLPDPPAKFWRLLINWDGSAIPLIWLPNWLNWDEACSKYGIWYNCPLICDVVEPRLSCTGLNIGLNWLKPGQFIQPKNMSCPPDPSRKTRTGNLFSDGLDICTFSLLPTLSPSIRWDAYISTCSTLLDSSIGNQIQTFTGNLDCWTQ